MVVEVKYDNKDNLKNRYLGTLKEAVKDMAEITKMKDLKLLCFSHYLDNINHDKTSGMFFTETYFAGRFEIMNDTNLIGHFTISCFPNCCGMCIITADYNKFGVGYSGKPSHFALLLACYIAQTFRYTAATGVDIEGSLNSTSYNHCKFEKAYDFVGKTGNDLRQYSIDLRNKDFLEQIKKLYE